jgi:hypothetical protein
MKTTNNNNNHPLLQQQQQQQQQNNNPVLQQQTTTSSQAILDRTNCIIKPTTTTTTRTEQQEHATDALLFQKLRAEAQELGLDSQSQGWAIIQLIHNQLPISPKGTLTNLLERIINTRENSLILLLPQNSITTTNITNDTILNHIIIIHSATSSSSSQNELYNLNGWKGIMEGHRILFTAPGQPINLDTIHHRLATSILIRINSSNNNGNVTCEQYHQTTHLTIQRTHLTRSATLPHLPSTLPTLQDTHHPEAKHPFSSLCYARGDY